MTYPRQDELLNRLMADFDYPAPSAKSAATKLLGLQPRLKPAFEQWWREGEFPGLEVEGYTVRSLMDERGLNPVAAFLALDWLIRDPEIAKETLTRGFDRIVND